MRQARSRGLGKSDRVGGRLALAGRSRAGAVAVAVAVATNGILLAVSVTAGVCGGGAIVIAIAGAFVLVLGACATDWTLACAVLAHIDGLLGY